MLIGWHCWGAWLVQASSFVFLHPEPGVSSYATDFFFSYHVHTVNGQLEHQEEKFAEFD